MNRLFESEHTEQIAAALAAAQGEMRSAPKTAKNEYRNSRYADLNSVNEAALPILSSHGLAVTQQVIPRAEVLVLTQTSIITEKDRRGEVVSTREVVSTVHALCVLRTKLEHGPTGQFYASEIDLVADWSDPQKVGIVITYMRRYAFSAIIELASVLDTDGEGARPDGYSRPREEHRRRQQTPQEAPVDVDDWDPPSDRSEPIPPREELPLVVPPTTGAQLLRFAKAMGDLEWFKVKIKQWKYGDRFSTLEYKQITRLYQEWKLKQRRNGSPAPAAAANGQPMTNGAAH